jgi:hypothetical protein
VHNSLLLAADQEVSNCQSRESGHRIAHHGHSVDPLRIDNISLLNFNRLDGHYQIEDSGHTAIDRLNFVDPRVIDTRGMKTRDS